MNIIFPGSSEIYKKLGKAEHVQEHYRMFRYCYTCCLDDKILIYNRITGTLVQLSDETMEEFTESQYAYDNWFSVPCDFNDEMHVLNCLGDMLDSKLASPAESEEICRSLYEAYIREKVMVTKRQNIFNFNQIESFCQQYGSPIYVFRKDDFIKNYNNIQRCFESKYLKYRIAYSFKTNYTPYICNLVKELGGFAEVVSDFELFLARRIGFADDCIIYNGPWKGELCEEFLLNGGLLNVDNETEMQRIIAIAKNNPSKEIKIGIRLNLDVGQGYISRFGISADDGCFERILAMVYKTKNLKLSGLHCHIAITNIQSWEKRSRYIINIIEKYSLKSLDYIDLGSGMHVRIFHDKNAPSRYDIRTLETYSKTALTPFNDFYNSHSDYAKPYIYTEPGALLIRNHIDFVTQVKAIKTVNNQQFVILNSSSLHLGNEWYLDHKPVLSVRKDPKSSHWCENATFVGDTCLESDKLYEGYSGFLSEGDFIVFGDVGAYSNVKKPPFISPSAPIISINDMGEVELLKKGESYEDLLKPYSIIE